MQYCWSKCPKVPKRQRQPIKLKPALPKKKKKVPVVQEVIEYAKPNIEKTPEPSYTFAEFMDSLKSHEPKSPK